jgi:hypothetical protein
MPGDAAFDLALDRRSFLQSAAAAGAWWFAAPCAALAQLPGERPKQDEAVRVVNPRGRVPMSFIIDDSTCLVNLAHYCIPQFAEVFPDRYKQDWRKLPVEIPDDFVRKFGDWCGENGVKGKYSVVPYPACVGWVDRDMPGWSRAQLEASLQLLRDFMAPNWDFHPEMVTHTWAIDTKTGRPYPERSEKFMENWGFSVGKSPDELTDYLGFALQILKNAGLHCEGVTTPGGFGGRSRESLAIAAMRATRDVHGTEIPHYFRDLYTGPESVAPQIYYASGLDGDDPQCSVSIVGCTGDWFGGWDGLEKGSVDQFMTEDLKGGRLPEVIDRGEPAILVCHWPGIYFNGEEYGFNVLKEAVRRLNARYDHLLWLKLSDIARYWAAKELTTIEKADSKISFRAPYACPQYTVEIASASEIQSAVLKTAESQVKLDRCDRALDLAAAKFRAADGKVTFCFDLPKGRSELRWM